MRTTIDLFAGWLSSIPGSEEYTLARGMYVEPEGPAPSRVAVIQQAGGRAPVGVIQYPQIRLLLMGSRDGIDVPGDMIDVERFAETLFVVASSDVRLDGGSCLINIMPLGSIGGPYYTQEGRPAYRLNFEIIR